MFIFLVVFALLLGYVLSGISGAPWVPTRSQHVEQIIKDSGLQKGELFIELGCGDGRLVVAAARAGARAIGYEVNPVMWLISWLRTLRYRKLVSVKYHSFWGANLSQADVVMTFLMPRRMEQLYAKLQAELKPKARFVSYIFELPHKKPIKTGAQWFVYRFSEK